jgi:endonuclease YncB( thermonuclease family)
MKPFKKFGTVIALLIGAITLTAKLSPQTIQRASSLIGINELGESKHYQIVAGSVHDGDSLRVNDGVREIKVVLCGLDAPELEQPLGTQARDHLQSLVAQGKGHITLVSTGIDKHGRTIADAFIPTDGEEEIHLNSRVLSDGMAYIYPEFISSCPNAAVMQRAERTAKDRAIGVWANPTATKPWDYRQRS